MLFPVDLVAGLAKNVFPSEATLAALVGAIVGLYLARKLWWGGAARLAAQARLELVSEQGQAFDPHSEEAQARFDNARANGPLGAGLLLFGIFLTAIFIGSYIVVRPIAVNPTAIGRAVQYGVMILFNLLVVAIEVFGARVYLKR